MSYYSKVYYVMLYYHSVATFIYVDISAAVNAAADLGTTNIACNIT